MNVEVEKVSDNFIGDNYYNWFDKYTCQTFEYNS